MKQLFAVPLILALTVAPALACNGGGNCENAPGHNKSSEGGERGGHEGHGGAVKGAPGPVAGAGLPFLAVGYGVYWLIKRRRANKVKASG
jgi:hypothetical protein